MPHTSEGVRTRLELFAQKPVPFGTKAPSDDLRPTLLALDESGSGTWEYEPGTGRMWISDSMMALQGYTREEAVAHPDYPGIFLFTDPEQPRYVHPDDVERVQACRHSIVMGGAGPFEVEFRIRHKDGRWLWVFQRYFPLAFDDNGIPVRLFGIRTDISARKDAEAELELAAERLVAGRGARSASQAREPANKARRRKAEAVDALQKRLEIASHYPRPFGVIDPGSQVYRVLLALEGTQTGVRDYQPVTGETWISDSMLAIQGYTRDQALQHPQYPDLFLGLGPESAGHLHPEDIGNVRELHRRMLVGETGPLDMEFRLRHKEGNWIWVHQTVRATSFDETQMPTRFVAMRSNITERKRAQSELAEKTDELRNAELAALRYQVNPHFLFNTLSSIATLIIDDEPKQAEQMVLGLARFYRSTLEKDALRKVTLREEIETQSHYLEIEKIRFPDELAVHLDIAAEAEQALIPSMLLQPLIENSIKYGLGAAGKKMTIMLSARVKADMVEIKVSDDGSGGSASAGTGVGLELTERRLATAYGENYEFTAGPRISGGYDVVLKFPFEDARKGGLAT